MANTIGNAVQNAGEAAQNVANGAVNAARTLLSAGNIVLNTLDGAMQHVAALVGPFSQVQKSAIELAKSAGLAGKSIMATSSRLIEQNRAMSLSMSYNVSNEDILSLQKNLMTGLQRNVAIDMVGTVQRNVNGQVVNPNFDSELENLVAASKVFGPETVTRVVSGFDKLGKSMNAAAKYTGKLFSEAGKYGINLQKYTENFTSNLEMAQNYNFRNGVDGLKEMARKATEIRQDMKQIASFAEKVGSVEGAVETASRLQVLGGSFAALANPLSMLNESLTDMEGLQDRFNDMTKGAAEYDSTTHQIRMSAFNRLRIKEAAAAMGVDPSNLIDQAYAQARQTEIGRQMEGIGGLGEDFKQLVKNSGEIDEYGRAGITVGGEFKSLSDLANMDVDEREALQKQLVEETRSESEDIKAIAKSVMGINDLLEGRKSQIQNEAARNDIIGGVVDGQSRVDMVVDAFLNAFTPEAILGGGKIDKVIGDLGTTLNTWLNTGLANMISPFAETTPEGIGEKMKEGIHNFLGDSDFSDTVSKFMGDITTDLTQRFSDVNEGIFKKYGLDMLAGNTYDTRGIPGTEQPPAAVSVTRNPISEFVTTFWQSGEGGTTAGGYYPAVIPSEQYDTWLTNLMGTLKANQATVPTADVMKPSGASNQTTSAGQTGADTTTQNDHNFNFTGTFTFVGDNGKITDKNIDELFRQHPELANEIAHVIQKAIEERRR